jgi:cyclopropane-fatty-acyl-phospholipid synthase
MSLEGQGEMEVIGDGRRVRRLGIVGLVLKRLLAGVAAGRLTVVTPAGARIDHRAAAPGGEAAIVFHRWRALRRLIASGDIGFAEAYIAGEWSSPDLTALIAMTATNCDYFERAILGWVPLRAFNRLRHLLKRNSKTGSRRNIAYHYDLGNEFYRLWLDRSMTYSSGLYGDEIPSLEEAQHAKQARVVDLLSLDGDESVLEIGCGWGSLAARLANHGARVTALTLSQQQLAFARELIAVEGVADRVDLRLEDYRDAGGRFDRIVSIEMLEAVGEAYWPVYFAKLRDRLKPGGKAVLQVITICEARFESYRQGTDFIQRYVFPGGLLPTKAIVAEQARLAGLIPLSTLSFGDSYAKTLAEWRRRFLQEWPEIEKLGFPPTFRRLWEYYLAYCEAAFRLGFLDVGLYVLGG